MSTRRGTTLHLLEVGLRWPPETFLRWKLEELAKRGYRVSVASTDTRDEAAILDGVQLVRIPGGSDSAPRKLAGLLMNGGMLLVGHPSRFARLCRAVVRPAVPPRRRGVFPLLRRLRVAFVLARLRPDIVHFEWESAAVYNLPLFDVWGCPVVVSCHGSGIHVHPHTGENEHVVEGYEAVFRKAAAVHVVSDAMRRDATRYGLDPAKARTIRPAVDPSLFRPSARSAASHELRVLAVGDLIWVKGHHYALQAIAHLTEDDVPVRLDVLGGDPRPETGQHSERPLLRFTIGDLGIDERVELHGEVSSARVLAFLQDADVLLHTSVSEGIPTVVLEAMSCGLPVVVSDCGGVREAIRDGVEGLIVPKRDPRATAEALLALWRDPALRTRMGIAGRERVLAEFSLERQVEAFDDLYRSVERRAAGRAPS
jgi:glycosyltransferase involved in cell wall biosynthesis